MVFPYWFNGVGVALLIIPPLILLGGAAHHVWRHRPKFQYRLPELILFPFAFAPAFSAATAIYKTWSEGPRQIRDQEMQFSVMLLSTFVLYQFTGAIVSWLVSQDGTQKGWRPAVMMMLGAWTGMLFWATGILAMIIGYGVGRYFHLWR